MNLSFLVLLLGIGLASAITEEQLMDMENDLDDDLVITDMDQAIKVAGHLRTMASLVREAEEIDAQNPQKRFIGSWFHKIGGYIKKAAKKVGDFFTNAYHKAADTFHSITNAIHFKDAVHRLIPFIHSGMTVKACDAACVGASTTILGPAAPLAGTLCNYVCDGALSEVQKLAG